jgi:regulator of nonsense transcripts 1
MDEYDYDSASQYGVGLDDTASMISGYTARTQKTTETGLHLQHEFDDLSVIDNNDLLSANGKTLDDDFDGVLDDVKDDTAADLPPHACRYTAC